MASLERRIDLTVDPAYMNEVLGVAYGQHELLKTINEAILKDIIQTVIGEINTFHHAALQNPSPDGLRRQRAIIHLTGPGSLLAPSKAVDGEYANMKELRWRDRQRFHRSFQIMALSAAYKSGQPLAELTNWNTLRGVIDRFGPDLLYIGRSEEVQATQKVIQAGVLPLPPNRVIYIDHYIDKNGQKKPITNTLQSIAALQNIPLKDKNTSFVDLYPWQNGNEYSIVADEYHLPRILRFARKYEDLFPRDVPMRVYPTTMPYDIRRITLMEICGILAYTYVLNKAEEPPYPHKLPQEG